MKPGHKDRIVDVLAFMCAEAYSVQMRGLARGSDGLAEITVDDASSIVIPILTEDERTEIKPYVDSLLSGQPDIQAKIGRMVATEKVAYPALPKRGSHVALV